MGVGYNEHKLSKPNMKNKIHSLYLLHNMKYGKRGWRREVCSIYYLCTQKDQSLKITKILTFSRSGCQTNFSFGYILLGEQNNQGTYRSLHYPFINTETENGKAPTSVLPFYCFETVKGLDT